MQLQDWLPARLLAALPCCRIKPEAPISGMGAVGLNGFSSIVHLSALGLGSCVVIRCFSSLRPCMVAALRKGNQSSEHSMHRSQV